MSDHLSFFHYEPGAAADIANGNAVTGAVPELAR
jgi:hypothetical protein